jgi:hypothetical protein
MTCLPKGIDKYACHVKLLRVGVAQLEGVSTIGKPALYEAGDAYGGEIVILGESNEFLGRTQWLTKLASKTLK